MKVSLGMIVKDVEAANPLNVFIENAQKYGRTPENVILAFSGATAASALNAIAEKCPLILIDLNDTKDLAQALRRRGVSEKAARVLLNHSRRASDKYPYGYSRNTVLLQALLSGVEALIFADSDVLPAVLAQSDGKAVFREVDFIGSHTQLIARGAEVTSSEYSGYHILPQARFEGQDALLIGLQKENLAGQWRESMTHHNLIFQPEETSAVACEKVLGGNMAIRLDACPKLSPFFSASYTLGGETFLTRGEDTILSKSIADNRVACIDTNTYIFHDTFGDYPNVPDLTGDEKIRRRFFYACMGWLGRNPFYNWLFGKASEEDDRYRLEMLKKGVGALYHYTNDARYLTLPDAFAAGRKNLAAMIDLYQQTVEAWQEFLKGCDLI